jgi:hypothetical protein
MKRQTYLKSLLCQEKIDLRYFYLRKTQKSRKISYGGKEIVSQDKFLPMECTALFLDDAPPDQKQVRSQLISDNSTEAYFISMFTVIFCIKNANKLF